MLDEGRRGKKSILERFISIANIGPSDMPKILDIARTTSCGHAFHASYAGYGSARVIFYFIIHIWYLLYPSPLSIFIYETTRTSYKLLVFLVFLAILNSLKKIYERRDRNLFSANCCENLLWQNDEKFLNNEIAVVSNLLVAFARIGHSLHKWLIMLMRLSVELFRITVNNERTGKRR